MKVINCYLVSCCSLEVDSGTNMAMVLLCLKQRGELRTSGMNKTQDFYIYEGTEFLTNQELSLHTERAYLHRNNRSPFIPSSGNENLLCEKLSFISGLFPGQFELYRMTKMYLMMKEFC